MRRATDLAARDHRGARVTAPHPEVAPGRECFKRRSPRRIPHSFRTRFLRTRVSVESSRHLSQIATPAAGERSGRVNVHCMSCRSPDVQVRADAGLPVEVRVNHRHGYESGEADIDSTQFRASIRHQPGVSDEPNAVKPAPNLVSANTTRVEAADQPQVGCSVTPHERIDHGCAAADL